eukprot:GHVU01082484.1.p1 GENE.GHVU01082484.1~~GHVU01082484.1.p1  ORF type:complete len:156 (+),score=52.76 GHVU01082484.1:17-484(+)
MSSAQVAVAAAVAAFTGLAFMNWRDKVNGKQLEKKKYEIEKKHVAMLEKMKTDLSIKSIDKAVRIAVQFAMAEGGKKKEVLEAIWKTKRCNTCGGKKDKETKTLTLYGKQHQFLEEMTKTFDVKSTDKAMRCLLEYCQTDGDTNLIFSVKRCKNC